jgi:hypothetical protein
MKAILAQLSIQPALGQEEKFAPRSAAGKTNSQSWLYRWPATAFIWRFFRGVAPGW